MGGIMSLTGEPEGRPMKVGVGVADVVCGMYAAVAILAALRERDRTGRGQHIDLALYDAQLAWLVNAGASYLLSGWVPGRHGNAHPHVVPYQTFVASDGEIALAVGNDDQFARLCRVMQRDDLVADPRFATNAARVENRAALMPALERAIASRPRAFWVDVLRAEGVPCGPVQDLAQAFGDPQTAARGMRVTMDHPRAEGGAIDLIGSPLKLSETPVTYRRPPPALGEHTGEVLREVLELTDDELASLRDRAVL
jgi:crotonobetainyl-CoA:carnitine CoA-transferase CaiB-like acyl-CoA transferase